MVTFQYLNATEENSVKYQSKNKNKYLSALKDIHSFLNEIYKYKKGVVLSWSKIFEKKV